MPVGLDHIILHSVRSQLGLGCRESGVWRNNQWRTTLPHRHQPWERNVLVRIFVKPLSQPTCDDMNRPARMFSDCWRHRRRRGQSIDFNVSVTKFVRAIHIRQHRRVCSRQSHQIQPVTVRKTGVDLSETTR